MSEAPSVTLASNASGFFTVPIATYASLVGRFSNVSVSLTYSRVRQTTQPCYVVTKARPSYGSSSLSVTVAVDPCGGTTTSANNEGLSTGAIVGIAVGAAVGGILIAVLVGLVVSACYCFPFRCV